MIYAYQLCQGSVVSLKEQWPLPEILPGRILSPSSCSDAKQLSSFPYVSVIFMLLPQCWSSEKMSLSKSMCWPVKRNCLGFQQFCFLQYQFLLVFTTRSFGKLLSWHWNPGTGVLMWGWDPHFSWEASVAEIFLPVSVHCSLIWEQYSTSPPLRPF